MEIAALLKVFERGQKWDRVGQEKDNLMKVSQTIGHRYRDQPMHIEASEKDYGLEGRWNYLY